jgi:hypothetical protein
LSTCSAWSRGPSPPYSYGPADDDRLEVEIAVRRGTRRGPFERVGVPWIPAGSTAEPQRPDEVDHEQDLHRSQQDRTDGHHLIDREQHPERFEVIRIGIAPRKSGRAENVHRIEGAVGQQEGQEEVDLPQRSFIIRPNIFGYQK